MRSSLLACAFFATTTLLHAARIDVSKYPQPIKVACVGDSITDGFGVGREWAYPGQLQRFLKEKWWVVNFGATGTTMLKAGDDPYWKHDQYPHALSFNPDVVIIALGTNDMKEKNWVLRSDFPRDYKEMIASFRALPSKPVIFLCLPPPITREVLTIPMKRPAEIGPGIRQIAKENSCEVIDFYSVLLQHPEWQPDNLHPDPNGDFALARTVYAALTGQSYRGGMILTTQAPKPQPWP
jgi:lysophospholipase L1-like esterase